MPQKLIHLRDRCQINLIQQRPVPITRGHSNAKRPQLSMPVQDHPCISATPATSTTPPCELSDTASPDRRKRQCTTPSATQQKVDGYTWSRLPGTDVEVHALTDKPLALRCRPSSRRSY